MIADKVTAKELAALERLQVTARKKGWIEKHDSLLADRIVLDATIEKVAAVLAKALKPDRKLVSAIRIADGAMQEISTQSFYDEHGVADAPYRNGSAPTVSLPEAPKKTEPVTALAAATAAATTVAAPHRGCPAPDFVSADLKARQVLLAFLDDGQRNDFVHYNRFVSVGATTGHRYMITSRHARDQLAQYQRSFYDLDEGAPLCVHDYSVPAAEEMLALHVLCSLPGYEAYLRELPADHDESSDPSLDLDLEDWNAVR